MPTHTYSTVLYDVTWTDIGQAVDSVQQVAAVSGVDLRVAHDTSGGTMEDGTTYNTETTFTATYEYALGSGDVALNELADALSQLSHLPDKQTIRSDIKARG